MEIDEALFEREKMELGDMQPGTCFLADDLGLNGLVCMRITSISEFDYGRNIEYTAVDLTSGDLVEIGLNEKYETIKAKLIKAN